MEVKLRTEGRPATYFLKPGLKPPEEKKISVETVRKIATVTSISVNKQTAILQNLRRDVKVESRAEEKLREGNHVLDDHFTCTSRQLDMKPEQESKKSNDEEAPNLVRHRKLIPFYQEDRIRGVPEGTSGTSWDVPGVGL